MRIAVVSPSLPTPARPMRGVTRFEQLWLFAAAGHDAFGVVPLPWAPRSRLAGKAVPDVERDGNVVVAHPRYPRVPRILGNLGRAIERRLFSRAAAAALGPTPDVVLAHSALLPGGMIGRVGVGGAVFVVSMHDHELYDWAPQSRLARAAVRRTLQRADCAVYVSEALRQSGTALAGPHRSAVIPTGVEVYPDIAPTPPRQFTVCSVTRLIARKRVDHLMRVFAQLGREYPEARLVIVGDGPERAALIRLSHQLGIADRLELTGALDARAARQYLAGASVMALPSVREALGSAYFEAMSLGVPPLATRGEGIAAHIEHGVSGILVPPEDDGALLAELRALAADRDRAARLGEAARRRFFAGRLTWQDNVQDHLELFAELLKGRAKQTT